MKFNRLSVPSKYSGYAAKLIIAVCIYLFFRLCPPFSPITEAGMQVVGIFFAVVYCWLTLGVGWTSFAAIILLGCTGIFTFPQILERSWGDNITMMVFGCLLMNGFLREASVLRRVAVWILTRPFARGKAWVFFAMFCLAVFAVGCFMPLTVNSIVFMALGEEILYSTGHEKGNADHVGDVFACAIAWISAVAASATLISHPYPLLAAEFVYEAFGFKISMLKYAAVGIPLGLCFAVILILVFRFIVHPDLSKLKDVDFDDLKNSVPAAGKREYIVTTTFICVIFLWILPDFFGNIPVLDPIARFIGELGTAAPILTGVAILFAIRVEGAPILEFQKAMNSVSWETITLIACAMALGDSIVSEKSGITAFLTEKIGSVISSNAGILFVGLAMLWVVLQTNFMSNAICAMLVTVIAPLAVKAGGVNPVVLGILVGSAANYSFATAASTSATAFVLGQKWTGPKFMAKYGFLMALIGVLLLTFMAYPLGMMFWV